MKPRKGLFCFSLAVRKSGKELCEAFFFLGIWRGNFTKKGR
jgi:hypothetical protein